MNSYRYRVALEQVADAKGQRFEDGRRLLFEAPCHDEMLQLVERVRERRVLPSEEETAAMMVGLKLLGEVVLQRRKEPLFADLHTALAAFIGRLKAAPAQGDCGGVEAAST